MMQNQQNQIQDVFERVEKKYLLNPAQYTALRMELSGRMAEDPYGVHTINNLYFDTDQFALIRASLEKPVYKEKLRLRSYGVPQEGTTVFFELKKKYKGIVYKRRIPLLLSQARRYIEQGKMPGPESQILREIDWFMQLYHPSPKVFIAYQRVALLSREDDALRVTFDSALRWRDTALDLTKGDWGKMLTDQQKILMEIKIPGSMPLWLCHLLARLGIYPCSFSKYGACYQNHLRQEPGGILCA